MVTWLQFTLERGFKSAVLFANEIRLTKNFDICLYREKYYLNI